MLQLYLTNPATLGSVLSCSMTHRSAVATTIITDTTSCASVGQSPRSSNSGKNRMIGGERKPTQNEQAYKSTIRPTQMANELMMCQLLYCTPDTCSHSVCEIRM